MKKVCYNNNINSANSNIPKFPKTNNKHDRGVKENLPRF